MATHATLESRHTLSCKLAAGQVDKNAGVIRDCTVATADVQAIGKFVFLDAGGKITHDDALAAKRLPVYTDEKTLATLLAASKETSRWKVREDHDDSIGARAGYADLFRLSQSGKAVVADIHLFASYRHKDLVLETVEETSKEIGLSIDFVPTFELLPDRALMRVGQLLAVDLVDEGAITPGGLFLSASVDKRAKVQEQPKTNPTDSPIMAAPSIEDLMSTVSELAKQMTECQAKITKMATPPAPAKDADGDSDAMKALRADNEKLSAAVKEQSETLKAVVAQTAQLKREKALMGFPANSPDRARLATASADEIEKINAGRKSYMQLVAEHCTANPKVSKADAHRTVQNTPDGKAAYDMHLSGKGVVKMTMAA